nr:MAG TPA: minor capsid component [Caudoviricetes sp.]
MADEIHALNKNEIQDIDYETYFGEMDLSDEEKEDRKKLAEKFEKIFVMLFALLSGKEETEITTITKEFIIRYESIATQYCKTKKTPSYITDYARYIVNEVVDATTQNTEVEYFTSQKRAKNVAANEANAVGNYRLQTEMVKQGYKTKEWRSKEDSHVRPTHAEVDRKRIDIFEPFEVGNSLMMFPKDHSLGAEVKEISNCRCSVKYYK